MRTADQILGILRERGTKQQPIEDIYRQLYNPMLYFRAYAKLYANDGAMTPGTTGETVDAMSRKKVETIIEALRYERYQWTPVRRIYIPKKSGKLRPLGLPSWSDKLLQEVIRLLLESYYEPQFSTHSHGFRPERGCHTALNEITATWTGVKWYVEGDISGCFDNINHEILLSILAEKIHDQRFLRLIRNLLKAGYMEDWRYHTTLSGTPQGGVCSPVLANLYLDKLDQYVEQTLLPTYNRGKRRRKNHQYEALRKQAVKKRKQGKRAEAKAILKQVKHMPSKDPQDPNYRRLKFCRYADDFLLGLSGSKEEAEEIKHQLAVFLRQTLKLELSQDKTLITHARTQAARFLGYEVVNQQNDEKRHKNGRRSINGAIGVRLPADILEKKSAAYMQNGFPTHRPELLNESDFTIIERFQSEYRGLVQYYLLAVNVCWLWKLHWIMKGSLLRTLAAKHKSTVRKMKRKYRATVITPYGKMECLEMQVEREGKKPLVARFGGIPLKRQKRVILTDRAPGIVRTERNELLKRLLADECELCGNTDNCEVHHVRKLADLKQPGRKEKPKWMQLMAARRRKTLVVCQKCHDAIHAGKPVGSSRKVTGEPCESKGSSTVRRGIDAKVSSN